MYIADLHIHSRFSRATSRELDALHLDWWARRKGIGLLGTGDFTHPAWRKELREHLVEAGEGVYALRPELRLPDALPGEEPLFVVTGEISCIYKRHGRTRKVHHLILLPSLEAAEELSARLEAIGNIHSDGRPILGLDSRDLLALTLEVSPEAELVPAHIWTPHFSLFGACSGFDTLEECFGDLAGEIHAVETGLSSDPPMNWRLSALDHLHLLSHSDAHSPSKLGREADLLGGERTYPALLRAVRSGEGLLGTVEFFPEEGKYHLDGHRNCGVCLTPAETEARDGLCPVCGKKLTIGVEHRVETLADRPMGYRPDSARPFESLAPLPEVIAASTGASPTGKKTAALYETMLEELGTEFTILRRTALGDIEAVAGPCVAEGIRRLRAGQVERRAGYDGVYGVISLLTPGEIQRLGGQLSLFGTDAKKTVAGGTRELKRRKTAEKAPAEAAPAEPNEAQQSAVTAPERVVAVVAGPGTGKTKTLVERIAYLVEERGVRPREITAVTFTNQAAAEMRQRLEKRLGGRRAVSGMTIGTFHAICLQLLGKVRLVSRREALGLAEQVLRAAGEKGSAKAFLQAVSRVKCGIPGGKDELDPALYAAYCAALEQRSLLDFDDLLIRALEKDTAGYGAFTHLLVDEFQDINAVQYQLLRAWSQGGRSLFVIGDPDQSIYAFRGADGQCFDRLRQEEPDTRVIVLTENYRSTPEVLEASLAVIQAGPGPERTLHPHCPAGRPVELIELEDPFQEGIFLAKAISRLTGGVDMLEAQSLGAGERTWAFSDIAVLCRTHRQLELVEKCLIHDDIPCIVSGREDYLEDDTVATALAVLRFAWDSADAAAAETALRLLWDCPADLLEKAEDALSARPAPDWLVLEETFRGYGPLEALLREAALWQEAVREEPPRRLVERWAERHGSSHALERLWNLAVFYPDFPALWQALTLGQEADLRRAAGKGWESGAVCLMTFHGAKGLEFPVVFAAGLSEGMVPLVSPSGRTDSKEERRLLYVAMTRARERLFLTCSGAPSPYLAALPGDVIRSRRQRERPAEQLCLF